MSRDKQTEIEKITDVLDKCTYDNKLKDEMALMLYNAGYRKASDLAEEIFAEIEDVINNIGYFDELDFEALKKKYTKEIMEEE
jgi:hypothetical protein